ncbi:hypothetical protein TNCV_2978221 [Trichonephila clavipes]|nr:hypothetical protein TNCV_2978221 [Trichonephila clavipes]
MLLNLKSRNSTNKSGSREIAISFHWRKRTALILKFAEKSERRWQMIAPDALPPTRVNLERSTEDVPETSKTDIQLKTENRVSLLLVSLGFVV